MAASLFISDLHLSESRAAANEAFFSFVEGKAAGAEALYILGDLFDYWIGDDDLADPFNALIAAFLQRLTRDGVKLFLMHGNRDLLMGERFCERSGARLLDDPTTLQIGGVSTVLLHGDTLCTADEDYQAWRRHLRSDDWQRRFLARPLADRRDAAMGMRESSRASVKGKPAEIMDVTEAAVCEAFRRSGARRMIHGHTHLPGRHSLEVDGMPRERWVLPDWYGRGGYLEVLPGRAPRLVRF